MKERLPMAVIPAGGRGMRLRPLTNELPKPFRRWAESLYCGTSLKI